jgi:hypothetical protein
MGASKMGGSRMGGKASASKNKVWIILRDLIQTVIINQFTLYIISLLNLSFLKVE